MRPMQPYDTFNGVCGTVKFKNFVAPDNMGLTYAESATVSASRAIAVNQMYLYFMPTAQQIVENGPAFNTAIPCSAEEPCVNNITAEHPWGVPLTVSLGYCTQTLNPMNSNTKDAVGFLDPEGIVDTGTDQANSYKSSACLSWEMYDGSIAHSVLLRGTELQDAVATYNGMMSASLYIASQASNSTNYKAQRSFISEARQTGWILAGAYYFRLAILTS